MVDVMMIGIAVIAMAICCGLLYAIERGVR